MNDLSANSTEELMQWLANATTTGAQALGHTKSAMNDRLVNLYKKELERRNAQIPTNDQLYAVGQFNGAGST